MIKLMISIADKKSGQDQEDKKEATAHAGQEGHHSGAEDLTAVLQQLPMIGSRTFVLSILS